MSLNRYAAKRDANEREIIQALKLIGARVWQQHSPFDLLVGYAGEWHTFEVKDGDKPPSGQKLTENEEEFFELCQVICVPHFVVKSAEEAVKILLERHGRTH